MAYIPGLSQPHPKSKPGQGGLEGRVCQVAELANMRTCIVTFTLSSVPQRAVLTPDRLYSEAGVCGHTHPPTVGEKLNCDLVPLEFKNYNAQWRVTFAWRGKQRAPPRTSPVQAVHCMVTEVDETVGTAVFVLGTSRERCSFRRSAVPMFGVLVPEDDPLSHHIHPGEQVLMDCRPKQSANTNSHWAAEKVWRPSEPEVPQPSAASIDNSIRPINGVMREVLRNQTGRVVHLEYYKAVLEFDHNGERLRALMLTPKYAYSEKASAADRKDLQRVLKLGDWVRFQCHEYDKPNGSDRCGWFVMLGACKIEEDSSRPVGREAGFFNRGRLYEKIGKVAELFKDGGLLQFVLDQKREWAYFSRDELYLNGRPCHERLSSVLELDMRVNFNAEPWLDQSRYKAGWRCTCVWRGEAPGVERQRDTPAAPPASAAASRKRKQPAGSTPRISDLDDFGLGDQQPTSGGQLVNQPKPAARKLNMLDDFGLGESLTKTNSRITNRMDFGFGTAASAAPMTVSLDCDTSDDTGSAIECDEEVDERDDFVLSSAAEYDAGDWANEEEESSGRSTVGYQAGDTAASNVLDQGRTAGGSVNGQKETTLQQAQKQQQQEPQRPSFADSPLDLPRGQEPQQEEGQHPSSSDSPLSVRHSPEQQQRPAVDPLAGGDGLQTPLASVPPGLTRPAAGPDRPPGLYLPAGGVAIHPAARHPQSGLLGHMPGVPAGPAFFPRHQQVAYVTVPAALPHYQIPTYQLPLHPATQSLLGHYPAQYGPLIQQQHFTAPSVQQVHLPTSVGLPQTSHQQAAPPVTTNHQQAAPPTAANHQPAAPPSTINHQQTAPHSPTYHQQTVPPSTINHQQAAPPSTTNRQQAASPSTTSRQRAASPSTTIHEQSASLSTIYHQQTAPPPTTNHQQTDPPTTTNHQQAAPPVTISHQQASDPARVDPRQVAQPAASPVPSYADPLPTPAATEPAPPETSLTDRRPSDQLADELEGMLIGVSTSADTADQAAAGQQVNGGGGEPLKGRGQIIAFVDSSRGLAEWIRQGKQQTVLFDRKYCYLDGVHMDLFDLNVIYSEGQEVQFECAPAPPGEPYEWVATYFEPVED